MTFHSASKQIKLRQPVSRYSIEVCSSFLKTLSSIVVPTQAANKSSFRAVIEVCHRLYLSGQENFVIEFNLHDLDLNLLDPWTPLLILALD